MTARPCYASFNRALFLLGLTAVLAVGAGACAPLSERPSPDRPGSEETGPARQDANAGPQAAAPDEPAIVFSGDFFKDPSLAAEPPRSVAVLPLGGDPSAWRMVQEGEDPISTLRRAAYGHMAALPFSDQELAETDRLLAATGLGDPVVLEGLLASDPARLRDVLGVEAVVSGRVTHYDRVFLGLVSQVAVGAELRLTRLTDGKTLWWARHVSRDASGGVSLSPFGLIMDAINSAWNLRGMKLLQRTDQLMREMAETLRAALPRSIAPARIQPLQADLFAVLPPKNGKVFAAGETMVLRLVGAPGGRAVASLPGLSGVAASVPLPPLPQALQEQVKADLVQIAAAEYEARGHSPSPEQRRELERELAATLEGRAIYEGVFTAPAGLEADLVPEARLLRPGVAMEAGPPLWANGVRVDGVAPAAPAGLTGRPLDKKVALTWQAVAADDLDRYEVLSQGGDGPVVLAAVKDTQAVVGCDENFCPVYLSVRAVDRAGNAGPAAAGVAVTPLPDPGLATATPLGRVLGGPVTGSAILRAAEGPFLVERDLVVGPGARLALEPGAVLRFAPGAGLKAQGGTLAAYGTRQAPVILEPAIPGGVFAGVAIRDGAAARLRHLRVRGAAVGLSISDSAPELEHLTVSGSRQAGMVLGDGAKPVLRCLRLTDNGGMGGMVLEGQGLAPRLTASVFTGNSPFHVQNYSGYSLDLSGSLLADPPPSQGVLGPARLEGLATTEPPCD